MLKECELDELKTEKELAYLREQAIRRKYKEAKKAAEEAYCEKQVAWDKKMGAEAELSCEMEKGLGDAYQRNIWAKCNNTCTSIYNEIDTLRRDAAAEHFVMKGLFKKAGFEKKHGDAAVASEYIRKGRAHRQRCIELSQEIKLLKAKIRKNEKDAERQAPRANKAAFERARVECDQARSHYFATKLKHDQLKEERDCLEKEYKVAQKDYFKLSETVQKEEEKTGKIDDKPLKTSFIQDEETEETSQFSWWRQIIDAALK